MERWSGKIAVVTGASSGIGWAIVKDLLEAGVQVVGLARRLQQMEALRLTLGSPLCDAFHPRECDVSSLSSIKLAFHWIEQTFGKLHILINNAGMAEHCKLLDEGNESALKQTIDVNLMGSIYCTKEAYRLMKLAMENSQEECHVINVNSLLGHTVPQHIPAIGLNIYPVAKHALRATNEVLRREMYEHKLLRLSTISPGLVQTEFGYNWPETDKLAKLPEAEILQPADVSRGVIFILASPAHVTIAELLMLPSREPY